jgi:hypothetical protein
MSGQKFNTQWTGLGHCFASNSGFLPQTVRANAVHRPSIKSTDPQVISQFAMKYGQKKKDELLRDTYKILIKNGDVLYFANASIPRGKFLDRFAPELTGCQSVYIPGIPSLSSLRFQHSFNDFCISIHTYNIN